MAGVESSTERVATILFADICESTPLYENTGDMAAYAVIGQLLDRHAGLVEAEGGVVIRSKGDDLLCTFERADAALAAAMAMLASQVDSALAIRIGIHHGSFVTGRGDIFGDAVNVAARLMSMARPDEGIVSAEVAALLGDRWRGELLPFDETTLKGKVDSIELHRLLPPEDDATEMATVLQRAARSPRNQVCGLQVTLPDGRTFRLDAARPVLRMGRADDADLQFASKRVSRRHASFLLRNGRATLADTSTLGSWLVTPQGEMKLRRESVHLVGQGQVFLGAHPGDDDAVSVAFSVLTV